MTPLYAVIPGSIRHVKQISLSLRPAACATLQGFGLEPRAALHRAFRASIYCQTATIENRPVAMWGSVGSALSDHAMIWAAFGEQAVRWPLAIVRRARIELSRMGEQSGCLYATIGKDDERAMVFAKTLGFVPAEINVPQGMVGMSFGGR
jgi:hypothetical protein